jgi:long-subunit acyl-CoA synthetase (AMP-forming)
MRRSTIDVFFETAAKKPDKVALRAKYDGKWREWSWKAYADDVKRAARAWVQLGVPANGAVAIIGPNKPEWLIGYLGAMAAGVVPAPIYPTSTPDQAVYIANHSESAVALVSDMAQLEKLRSQKPATVKKYVLMSGAGDGAEVLSWEEFLKLGAGDDAERAKRLAAIEPGGLATLIYTSGTTGPPKAVMITHGNCLFAAESNKDVIGLGDDEHLVSYLPLSHIAEQMLSIHGAVVVGATIHCCEKFEALPETLRECRPTVMFGVPRVWEKIQSKMAEAGAQAKPLQKKIAAWARKVGLEAGYAQMNGKSTPLFYGVAKKVVFSKVRARLGLDRCWFAASGAAPISKSTLEFFLSLDIPIYEVYGQSEVTGAATIAYPKAWRLGTVGKTLGGTEIKLAADGEILIKGPHVFKGYLKDPAATKEALGDDGYIRTGDVGEFDGDGFLRITDRKKDLLKTSGGKYVAPQNLEGLLKGIANVGQAVVIGDNRKYCVALLTLDGEKANGRQLAELAKDPSVLGQIEAGVAQVNSKLAPYESIKKWKLLPVEFTVDSGELTPTLKVKRKVVSQKFSAEIESMYQE